MVGSPFPGHLVSPAVGRPNSLTLGQWDSGTMGQWDNGIMGQWDNVLQLQEALTKRGTPKSCWSSSEAEITRVSLREDKAGLEQPCLL